MTRLLVSVRDADEAAAAVRGGADLIDIKEPGRGPLGRASVDAWRSIRARVGDQAALSAALGEWNEPGDAPRAADLNGFAFVKLGLAGISREADWIARWRESLAPFAPFAPTVAVAYADWRRADAPNPFDVLRAGRELGCAAALCDTWRKDGPLTNWLSPSELKEWTAAAREAGMRVAIAGSLTESIVDAALDAHPDWIAVRGAVCSRGREGIVDEQRVRAFSARVKSGSLDSTRNPRGFRSGALDFG